ncbi:MAG: HAD-IA family hydrolase [Bacteroidales bacterium]|jgi:beta-phosphoglucomutase family hydrolase|nr:HAD-IA family hydrolase [Bacteroidales bacterium]
MAIEVSKNAKGLIFDLDGTLSDSLQGHVSTWNMVGEKYGFVFDVNMIIEMTGRPTIEFAKKIVEQFGIAADPKDLAQTKQEAFWDLAKSLQPINEVVSIVKEYYGKLPMAVGTGAGRKTAHIQLETLNITKYFNAIVSADDVRKYKPEPHTFLKCARLIGVEPQYCQVFEDGVLGIIAAQNAGMMVTDVRPYINYGAWLSQ